jgi:2-oxoglutarate dehydrogenase E2 component (dihydrolipoamide succinyltransferase)
MDENLIDIETDKVVLELPSPVAGVIKEIFKTEGERVASGEIIALIETDDQATVTVAASPASAPSKSAPPMPESPSRIVMPAAARMLAENKLDVTDVTATGPGGRVTKGDVIDALEGRPPAARVRPTPESPPIATGLDPVNRPQERVPMSRLRARIAERLMESQANTATLTTFNEVNMQPVIDLRNKYSAQFEKEHGVRLGFMSFFIKAAVAALKRFPIINASIDGNDIVYHGFFDIGIAISSPRGLVVPIMRDVDTMTIAEIEKKIVELSARARDGQLTLEDLTGGTFSISNGGVFGSLLSTPILNPPQSAILGIHATRDRPVAENGQVVIRPMNYLALSYDHRLIDGREAVLALVVIKETMEDPARLLLEL